MMLSDNVLKKVKKSIIDNLKEVSSNGNEIVGFISRKGDIYTIGSDSKIIGRLFEVLTQPILQKVALELNMDLHESPKQTIYPDFWLSDPDDPNRNRIAIDIKTTYRKSANSKFKFTLGSYTSFLRNGTKNIAGSYNMYGAHLIIGFVYTRNKEYTFEVVPFSKLNEIKSPVHNIDYFVAEKYKISGEKPGSGNTANIGTISSKEISDFSNGNGPFAILGKETFEDYWRNYPTPSQRDNGKYSYTDLKGFVNWKAGSKNYQTLKKNLDKISDLGLKLQ